jgi:hypothetical protein
VAEINDEINDLVLAAEPPWMLVRAFGTRPVERWAQSSTRCSAVRRRVEVECGQVGAD